MGFKTMIFGFFFLFFDLNLNNINVLPEVIGYIILYSVVTVGVTRVPNHHFLKLKNSYLLLILLSGLELVIKYSPLLNGTINDLGTVHGTLFSVVFNLALVSLAVYSMFHLTKGIEFEAAKSEDNQLISLSRYVFKLVSSIQVIFALISIGMMLSFGETSLNFDVGGFAGFIMVLIFFAVHIYIIFQVWLLLKQAHDRINQNIVF